MHIKVRSQFEWKLLRISSILRNFKDCKDKQVSTTRTVHNYIIPTTRTHDFYYPYSTWVFSYTSFTPQYDDSGQFWQHWIYTIKYWTSGHYLYSRFISRYMFTREIRAFYWGHLQSFSHSPRDQCLLSAKERKKINYETIM